ncbi:MAG: alpha/beta fold hydrolase [Mariniblastus sp.]|nr:alpha/beta fold hydrolase [Mariniblastus sp.]
MSSFAFQAVHQTGATEGRDLDGPCSDWKSEFDYESRFLSLGSVRMHYVDPSSQAADPILMVHGNPTWSFFYRRQIRDLQDRYRTIAVDHIGCGLSDKPVDYPYCLETHISNLCRLIDELDLENAVLMAHDWGGAIGLGALLRRRERFKRIILMNTGAFPPPYIPLRIRVCRWPVVGKIGVQGLNLFARAATRMATTQRRGLPDRIAQGFLAPYDSWSHRTAIYQFVKDIPVSPHHSTWPLLQQIEQDLPSLADWPIQLIWGMKDWCFRPECLERFQEYWPQSRACQIETAGHYVIEDAPDEVGDVVNRFLQETDDGARLDQSGL